MTSTIGVRSDGNSGAAAKKFGDEIAASLVTLMAALETSLAGSRKALVSLDLGGLVKRNREQILLSRELAAVLYAAGGERDALPGPPGLAEELGTQPLQIEQVRMIAKRIITTIRLHHALLARSRSKLRVMANMLAGPSAAYGPMLTD